MTGLILQVNLLIRCEAVGLSSKACGTERRGNQVLGDVREENQQSPERNTIVRLSGHVVLVSELQQLAMAFRPAKG